NTGDRGERHYDRDQLHGQNVATLTSGQYIPELSRERHISRLRRRAQNGPLAGGGKIRAAHAAPGVSMSCAADPATIGDWSRIARRCAAGLTSPRDDRNPL